MHIACGILFEYLSYKYNINIIYDTVYSCKIGIYITYYFDKSVSCIISLNIR